MRVFNNKEVGMMTTYLEKGWRHLKESERPIYQGLVGQLHSHVEQENFNNHEEKMMKTKTREELQAASDTASKERWARFKNDPEAVAAWNEALERIKIVEDNGTPILDDEPVLPVVTPEGVAARLKADKQHQQYRRQKQHAKGKK